MGPSESSTSKGKEDAVSSLRYSKKRKLDRQGEHSVQDKKINRKSGASSEREKRGNKTTSFEKGNTKGNKLEDHSVSNKKRALKQSRQAHRPHADTVFTGKAIWNKLRSKHNTPAQISVLMSELMPLIKGKVAQIAAKHDASRIVQAALQFGNQSQRKDIVDELRKDYINENTGAKSKSMASCLVKLSKSQYAHFVILKLITYCAKETENISAIVEGFKGHIPKLAIHSVGSRVIETLFLTFPPKSTAVLKLEFYGPQFTMFTSGEFSSLSSDKANHGRHPTLSSVLEKESDSKKTTTIKFFKESIIQKGIEKNLFGFGFFQQLLLEFVLSVPSKKEIRDLAPSIVDHSIHLLSTKAGARVVAECAAYGTPKDRRRIMKNLKGFVRSSLLHSDAYFAILRLIDVTDDTVNIQRSILAELLVPPSESDDKKKKIAAANQDGEDEDEDDNKNMDYEPNQEMIESSNTASTSAESSLLSLALSDTGSKLFLLLLVKNVDDRKKYFDPLELEFLHPNPCIVENGHEIPTSKKNPSTRRTELVEYLKNSLIELCCAHSSELLKSIFGSRVLKEVYETWPCQEIADAILKSCVESEEDQSSEVTMFEHPIGHLTIKNLLLFESGCQDDATDRSELRTAQGVFLAKNLFRTYRGRLMRTIGSSNRGAFVLAALVAVEGQVGKDVRKELSNGKKEILKSAQGGKGGNRTAGYEALAKSIS